MRLRLLLSFVLVVLISVLGVVILARSGAANEVRAFMFRGGMTDTDELVNNLEENYRIYGSWEYVDEILHMPGKSRGIGQGGVGHGGMGGMMRNQRLILADPDGMVILDTSAESLSQQGLLQLSSLEIQNAIPLRVNNIIVGYFLVESSMSFSIDDESFLVYRLTRAALIAGAVAAAISLLLALLLAYSLMRPVRELTRAARRLGEGDLLSRVQIHGSDELALLGRTFNQMADSLLKVRESRKAMTADIAHELRNPLAVQRANLEALQDGVIPLSPENFNVVLEQNLLLTHLVDDLRTLALADIGQLELERIPTDMNAMLQRIIEGFKPDAKDRQVELIIAPFEPKDFSQVISVDPTRIEQILNNLLSNALRFTPVGGYILVSMWSEEQVVIISLHDSGPGMHQEALPHIFDRFYRADRSRSRSEGGTGLGLAIARHLAEAHGGTLTVANHPESGAVFTLTIPILNTT